MDEDEFDALTLNASTTVEPAPPPPPAPAVHPIPPPIAPIPPPPPSALLRVRAATAAAGGASDSDREDSLPPPRSADDYEVSEESRLARERHEKAVQELLMKRRAFAMAVPTNDVAVRARLRRLGEPVTLFGEREMERRDRLREIMLRLDNEGHLERLLKAHEEEQQASAAPAEDEGPQVYPFYTEGSPELLNARMKIVKYSLERAAARLERARRRRNDPDEDEDAEAMEVVRQAGELVLECSEIGDDRPLTGCSFSHDGTYLATSAWSGITKTWRMPEVSKYSSLKGHTDRVTDVVFSPTENILATASADKTAKLWKIDGSLLYSLVGHVDRLCRIAFHPSGKYLGTASFDKTWRLWDIDTGAELLLQEGHSRRVYAVCFHPDGSLVASCGLDALIRVWDLRTGRSILALEGHVKPVLGICFSPNGYRLASGGEDNACRIWDLRKRKCEYTIPAHSNLVSQVKYEPQEGYFLATSSYDTKAMVWSAQDFKPIRILSGHESLVTGLDITGDSQHIATVAHDRTIKIWSSRSNSKQKAMDVD
ncbi:U4/U6 small nuclear ribonucleoprotein PRP4-like protein [Apostasia shenzhenica]|uniref:U4/U6 small nuclear ribonucleoprotein PRP4-like protein n=1 Tax=Apostasia shenzhenica TaxID=1088818 RepID=A0A2I0AAK8_9ASPA|nr:U4/U6 small nuclear ribonucleoprotein PRP4-like protein [Apostasia shenzhenica]